MNLDYVSKIKFGLKRYKTIATDKTTSRVLDGSYNSIYKGRSMNFDELREYVPGDDIKDIDWKATSRSQKVLIRSYIAEKKHNIMLVMDANHRMLGQDFTTTTIRWRDPLSRRVSSISSSFSKATLNALHRPTSLT